MKLQKRFVILLKMIRTEGICAESFIRKASTMRKTGMKISIMEILLLMMLLLYQQNCRLHHVPSLGCQECRSNLVLLSSARDNHLMAEAEGYVDNQLPRVSEDLAHAFVCRRSDVANFDLSCPCPWSDGREEGVGKYATDDRKMYEENNGANRLFIEAGGNCSSPITPTEESQVFNKQFKWPGNKSGSRRCFA
jgi:hypothetical protein